MLCKASGTFLKYIAGPEEWCQLHLVVISHAHAHAHINLNLLSIRVFYGWVVALDPDVLHKLGFGTSASFLALLTDVSSNRSDSFCPRLLCKMDKYRLILYASRRLTGAENHDMIFSSRDRISCCRNKAFEPGKDTYLGAYLVGYRCDMIRIFQWV